MSWQEAGLERGRHWSCERSSAKGVFDSEDLESSGLWQELKHVTVQRYHSRLSSNCSPKWLQNDYPSLLPTHLRPLSEIILILD